MPSTCSKELGVFSMTSKSSSPNRAISLLAYTGPMPLTMPLPRYFSMPSRVFGGMVRRCKAFSCRPWSLSTTQSPSAVSHSPAETVGAEPTTGLWPFCNSTIGVTNGGSEREGAFLGLRIRGEVGGEAGETIDSETTAPDLGAELMNQLLSGGARTFGSGSPLQCGWGLYVYLVAGACGTDNGSLQLPV